MSLEAAEAKLEYYKRLFEESSSAAGSDRNQVVDSITYVQLSQYPSRRAEASTELAGRWEQNGPSRDGAERFSTADDVTPLAGFLSSRRAADSSPGLASSRADALVSPDRERPGSASVQALAGARKHAWMDGEPNGQKTGSRGGANHLNHASARSSPQAPSLMERGGPHLITVDPSNLTTHFAELELALPDIERKLRGRALLVRGASSGGGSANLTNLKADEPGLGYIDVLRALTQSIHSSSTRPDSAPGAALPAHAAVHLLQEQSVTLLRLVQHVLVDAESDAARLISCEARCTELQHDNAGLRTEAHQLTDKVTQASVQLKRVEETVVQVDRMREQANTSKSKLKKQLEALTQQNTVLKNHLVRKEEEVESLRAVGEADLSRLRVESEGQLSSHKEKAAAASKQLRQLSKRCDELQRALEKQVQQETQLAKNLASAEAAARDAAAESGASQKHCPQQPRYYVHRVQQETQMARNLASAEAAARDAAAESGASQKHCPQQPRYYVHRVQQETEMARNLASAEAAARDAAAESEASQKQVQEMEERLDIERQKLMEELSNLHEQIMRMEGGGEMASSTLIGHDGDAIGKLSSELSSAQDTIGKQSAKIRVLEQQQVVTQLQYEEKWGSMAAQLASAGQQGTSYDDDADKDKRDLELEALTALYSTAIKELAKFCLCALSLFANAQLPRYQGKRYLELEALKARCSTAIRELAQIDCIDLHFVTCVFANAHVNAHAHVIAQMFQDKRELELEALKSRYSTAIREQARLESALGVAAVELQSLQGQVQQSRSTQQQLEDAEADVARYQDEVQGLKAQLREANSLQQQLDAVLRRKALLQEHEEGLAQSPEGEREYAGLVRELEEGLGRSPGRVQGGLGPSSGREQGGLGPSSRREQEGLGPPPALAQGGLGRSPGREQEYTGLVQALGSAQSSRGLGLLETGARELERGSLQATSREQEYGSLMKQLESQLVLAHQSPEREKYSRPLLEGQLALARQSLESEEDSRPLLESHRTQTQHASSRPEPSTPQRQHDSSRQQPASWRPEHASLQDQSVSSRQQPASWRPEHASLQDQSVSSRQQPASWRPEHASLQDQSVSSRQQPASWRPEHASLQDQSVSSRQQPASWQPEHASPQQDVDMQALKDRLSQVMCPMQPRAAIGADMHEQEDLQVLEEQLMSSLTRARRTLEAMKGSQQPDPDPLSDGWSLGVGSGGDENMSEVAEALHGDGAKPPVDRSSLEVQLSRALSFAKDLNGQKQGQEPGQGGAYIQERQGGVHGRVHEQGQQQRHEAEEQLSRAFSFAQQTLGCENGHEHEHDREHENGCEHEHDREHEHGHEHGRWQEQGQGVEVPILQKQLEYLQLQLEMSLQLGIATEQRMLALEQQLQAPLAGQQDGPGEAVDSEGPSLSSSSEREKLEAHAAILGAPMWKMSNSHTEPSPWEEMAVVEPSA
eukprot:gene21868-28900_t